MGDSSTAADAAPLVPEVGRADVDGPVRSRRWPGGGHVARVDDPDDWIRAAGRSLAEQP